MQPIYLDHNATTPLGVEARQAMEPYLGGQFGNPLTAHRFGQAPRAAVDAARGDLLDLFGAARDRSPWSVTFNSGASEGLNHALKGLAFACLVDGRAGPRRRIVIGGLEHYAVEQPVRWLEGAFGFEVVRVAPNSHGVIPAETFVAEIDPDTTLLAALHWANNEIGTLQPVREVGAACRAAGVPFVCDAVQVVGKVATEAACTFADLITVSAHKFYGPKGAGALLVREGFEPVALVHGAAQEGGLRGGTHNVAGIVGLVAAANAARACHPREEPRLSVLRDALWNGLHESIDAVHWNGKGAAILPNTLNVSFDGCPSHRMCEEMDERGVAISAGAACDAGTVRPSRNLLAMGLSESRALTSVRVSLGHGTTDHEIHTAVEAFAACATVIRQSG